MTSKGCYYKDKSNPYYIDILNPEVVRAFIDSTYEKYYSRFKDEFGKGLDFLPMNPSMQKEKYPGHIFCLKGLKKSMGMI